MAIATRTSWLEFEKPLIEIEKKIEDLRSLSAAGNEAELRSLEAKASKLRKSIYSNLSRWQIVQLARHPQRPYTLDYLKLMESDFTELHGDRLYADDNAMVAGFATIGGNKVFVVGQQKGRDTAAKLRRNFGMAHPEGYRKALRIMGLGAKFGKPIVCFLDTPGAYPGIGAEERGQAEAIARNLREMALLPVPIVVVVIGEGGSGGALGIGVGDVVLMLEYAIYSVISPEGCAAILWRDAAKAPEAADAMKITAADLSGHGLVDEVIPEPPGGAHRDPQLTAERISDAISKHLTLLSSYDPEELVERRIAKYREMGSFTEG